MAFEKVRAFQYICDTKEDLKKIPEKKMGVECFVIKEACEYKLMSDGEWIKQIPVGAGAGGNGDIDLSDYATEQYVDNAIANIEFPETDLTGYATEEFVKGEIAAIQFPETDLTGLATEEYVSKEIAAAVSAIEIPSIEGLASETYVDEHIAELAAHPVFKTFASEDMPSSGHLFGIYLEAKENKTLVEKMMETGLGMYNFWIGKGAPGQPDEVVAKNSSCRGLCCYDTANGIGGKYGWILMIDQDGDFYVQYIRNGIAQGWKSFVTAAAHKEAIEKLDAEHKEQLKACYRPVKYEITDVPTGTIVDYRDKEIRIFCPESVKFEKQNVGEGGNANMYYMTFITYAPEGAVALREGDKGVILDELISLENGTGCGVDKFGRKYKKHWFALASYDNNTGAWTYRGKASTIEQYVGWTYVVAWYDKDNRMIDTDILRINLSNKDCHLVLENSYIDEEATIWAELPE